jgi:hypothetical protein
MADDGNFFDGSGPPPGPRGAKPKLRILPPGPLVLRAAALPEPCSIPPRPWLYGTQLIRGFVTVLVAPGGTGKTAYAMAVAIALATGVEFLGQHIFASGPTAVLNLEDPMDELNRRVAAIQLRHKLDNIQLADRLYLHSGDDRPITIAELSHDGFNVVYPDEEAIITQINEHGIIALVVDPYAESHSLEENSNPHMVKAAAAWRRIANATFCAILLVHHVRKGAVTDIDAARGAKALTDSARVGLILSPMSTDEAETFGVPDLERTGYVRLDDAKVNLAPKANKARWFHLEQVELGNRTNDYPSGDKVASVALWEPPNLWQSATLPDINFALDRIDAGLPGGGRFTDSRRGDATRWAGHILVEMFAVTQGQAATMIRTWLATGLLFKENYHDKRERKDRVGLNVNHTKRPGAHNA